MSEHTHPAAVAYDENCAACLLAAVERRAEDWREALLAASAQRDAAERRAEEAERERDEGRAIIAAGTYPKALADERARALAAEAEITRLREQLDPRHTHACMMPGCPGHPASNALALQRVPYYLADGSAVMLPLEEVERLRKLAAKVIDAARKVTDNAKAVVLRRPLPHGAGAISALARAVDALGPDPT